MFEMIINDKKTKVMQIDDTLMRVNRKPEVWQFLGFCHAGHFETPDKEK